MATLTNTFNYFANTSELSYSVSASELAVGTANNQIELTLPFDTISFKAIEDTLILANTISVPSGTNVIDWELTYTDDSSTGSANGSIEISNFEYSEIPVTWNLSNKEIIKRFEITLDCSAALPNTKVFCCATAYADNIPVSGRHVDSIFETTFNQNVYLPFPNFTNRTEVYSIDGVSTETMTFDVTTEAIGETNYSSLLTDGGTVSGKVSLYLGILNGRKNDTVTASATITEIAGPTSCSFDLQDSNFFIQNATYNSNTEIYDTKSAFLIGVHNLSSSSEIRFCEVNILGEDVNIKKFQVIGDDNSSITIGSAQSEMKFTFTGLDGFGNQTTNTLSANCLYSSKSTKVYKSVETTPDVDEVLEVPNRRTISFIQE